MQHRKKYQLKAEKIAFNRIKVHDLREELINDHEHLLIEFSSIDKKNK